MIILVYISCIIYITKQLVYLWFRYVKGTRIRFIFKSQYYKAVTRNPTRMARVVKFINIDVSGRHLKSYHLFRYTANELYTWDCEKNKIGSLIFKG